MITDSDTYQIIRNKACVVCGVSFIVPRAGKLYCSKKCKQFAHYHKNEITHLKSEQKGVNDSVIKVSRKEYEEYNTIRKKVVDYSNLKKRQESPYSTFDKIHSDQLKKLERALPKYLKEIKIPSLSIEEWSFLKVLYKDLKRDDFLKLLSSFKYKFYENLILIEDQKNRKTNPVQTLYSNHILKIVEGKILFI